MESTTSRESILSKVRKALAISTSLPFPNSENRNTIFSANEEEDEAVLFAEKFTSLQGKFVYSPHEISLQDQLRSLISKMGWEKIYCKDPLCSALLDNIEINISENLDDCDVSIAGCEALVSNTGSILVTTGSGDRTTSIYAPIHITIAFSSQIVSNLSEAFIHIRKKYGNNIPSFISVASGPSRTADIEKTLVTGVHGPKAVYCFLLEDH
jgi:L-lactate dehydrogenase complex protein LldG